MNNLPICPTCTSSKKAVYKYAVGKFNIYFCKRCRNGFTFPVPKNLAKYYYSTYWIFPGIIGLIRSKVYNFFQLRRAGWIQSYLNSGTVLDVGSGEGVFGSSLPQTFHITNIDTPFAKIKNKSVLKKNFLTWRTNKKFDTIVFWESLEHTPNPLLYLKKARSLLKQDGYIFIEYPTFSCFESKLFQKYWFHLDPPRHLVHLSTNGMEYLARKARFKILSHKNVFALEYICIGFVASLVNLFNISTLNIASSNNKIYFILLFIPLGFFSLIAECIFFIFKQSPIRLIALSKSV